MKLFKIWIIGFLLIYFIPAGIGAFVNLDWSSFDFTTWKAQGRILVVFFEVVWTLFFLAMMEAFE